MSFSRQIAAGDIASIQSRQYLSSTLNLWIRATGGSDTTGDGLSFATGWATLQHAIDYAYKNLDAATQSVVINCGTGTYTAGAIISGPLPGNATLTIGGSGGAASAVFSTGSSDAIVAKYGAVVKIQNLKVTNTGSSKGVSAQFGGLISFGSGLEFGACGDSQIDAAQGGNIVAGTSYAISGGATSHMHAHALGIIQSSGITVTLTNTPAYSAYFAGCGTGYIEAIGTTYSGSATGNRFTVVDVGAIRTNSFNLNYFPGDTVNQNCCARGGSYDGIGYPLTPLTLSTGVAANGAMFTVPVNCYLDDIVIFNTTANAVTGGINIGTSALGNDVASAVAVGANGYVNVGSALLKKIFSQSASQALYISAATGWNAASLSVYGVSRPLS